MSISDDVTKPLSPTILERWIRRATRLLLLDARHTASLIDEDLRPFLSAWYLHFVRTERPTNLQKMKWLLSIERAMWGSPQTSWRRALRGPVRQATVTTLQAIVEKSKRDKDSPEGYRRLIFRRYWRHIRRSKESPLARSRTLLWLRWELHGEFLSSLVTRVLWRVLPLGERIQDLVEFVRGIFRG